MTDNKTVAARELARRRVFIYCTYMPVAKHRNHMHVHEIAQACCEMKTRRGRESTRNHPKLPTDKYNNQKHVVDKHTSSGYKVIPV